MIHKKWHNSHCKFADGFAFPLVDWATLSRLLRFVVALRFLQKPHIKTVLVWEANFQSGYGSSFPNTVRFATCSINMIYDIMICSFFCAFKIFNKFGNAHFWKNNSVWMHWFHLELLPLFWIQFRSSKAQSLWNMHIALSFLAGSGLKAHLFKHAIVLSV